MLSGLRAKEFVKIIACPLKSVRYTAFVIDRFDCIIYFDFDFLYVF